MTVQIDLWSDVACPWCYLGKKRLEDALAATGLDATVRLRAFELDPSAPTEPTTILDYLSQAKGLPVEQAAGLETRMVGLAAADDLPYTGDRPHANSFDAHRVVALARTVGLDAALMSALQRELFGSGVNVYARSELQRIAVAAGLDADRVAAVLASEEFVEEVRADERLARELGITGVPFAVLNGRYAIPGAVSTEEYATALEAARDAMPRAASG